MLYYVYLGNAGVPAEGLSPEWLSLQEAGADGHDLTGTANDNATLAEVGATGNPSLGGGGWYYFDITFGKSPWDSTTVDLVGVIDGDPGGVTLADVDRYKPVVISLRGLGLARISHKGIQNKTTGDIIIYQSDGVTEEMTLNMTDDGTDITRNPESA